MKKEDATTKKPIYKKWWFWMLIVIFIGLGASGQSNTPSTGTTTPSKDKNTQVASGTTTPPTESNTLQQSEEAAAPTEEITEEPTIPTKPEPAGLGDGTYKVGTDMDAGEYLILSKGFMSYVEISSDSTGDLNSIISNANFSTHMYLTVKEGDYVKIQSATAYKVAEAPSIVPADGLYQDGVYKVGSDIPAGEYKVHLTSEMGVGYVEIASGSRGTLDEIISNDNPTGDSYITVTDGQYLKLQGVEIQK